ncbi:MAG: alpha/beta fold hydrolase [Bradyrhizobium sp.]
MRLFCLPYAGGSAMFYARWRRTLPRWIEVEPVELPGRGARMDEPLDTDLCALAERLAAELQRMPLDRPYGLFGHSLGALLAFEMAHALLDRGARAPSVLFASGAEAPTVRDGRKWKLPLSDDALRAELKDRQGTPDDVLDNPAIMRAVLPVLRADFLMSGTYAYRRRKPLPCPIHVFGGDEDTTLPDALDAWRRETSDGFDLDMLPGHHFFIHDQQSRLLSLIVPALAQRSEQLQRGREPTEA